jgi:hypothetical protein
MTQRRLRRRFRTAAARLAAMAGKQEATMGQDRQFLFASPALSLFKWSEISSRSER